MASDERRLLKIFRLLGEEGRATVLAFAEFLESRLAATPQSVGSPIAVQRPERESVIGALKRLSATYPMLDKAVLLNETSLLVSQHVMHGRDAVEVIDELEVLFRRHYEHLAGTDDASK